MGQYTRFGNAIRIDATLQDLDRQQAVPLNAMAPNEGSLLTAITELAGAVRQSLARGSPDVLKELTLTARKPSTSSFEALRLYDEGLGLTREGKQQAALKSFEAATNADGNFALAFSGLAQAYATLGYDAEAGQFSRRAMSLAEALPPQEKYLISANHYRIVNDTPKAIEAYENLAKASPNNATVQFDLGTLYEKSGAFDQARERFAKVVALDPKFVDGLRALGRVEIRRGNPQGSLDHLNTALTLAIQLENEEARADVLQAIGVAYKRLDRLDEALRRYEESLEIKRKLGQKRGMAASLGEIAQIQEVQGQTRESEQSYREALGLQREIGDKAGISTSLVNLASLLNDDLGRPDDALPLLREALQIRRDVGNANGEAIVLNNIGSVYLGKGQYSEGQTYFERALELREKTKVPGEIADTLHNLAETLSKEGRFDQALARYLRALDLRRGAGDRRGAAIESYSIGTIFDYQGRYGAAVKSKEEALQTFRDLKQKDRWLGEILSGLGRSLALSGRTDDSGKQLDEAMNLVRELKNPSLTTQIMTFQADRLYYSGDTKGANRLAEQALQTGVTHIGSRDGAPDADRDGDDCRRAAAQPGARAQAGHAGAGSGHPGVEVCRGRMRRSACRDAAEARRSRQRAEGSGTRDRAGGDVRPAPTAGDRPLSAGGGAAIGRERRSPRGLCVRAASARRNQERGGQPERADARRPGSYPRGVFALGESDLSRRRRWWNAPINPEPSRNMVAGSGTAFGAWTTVKDWKLSSLPPMEGSVHSRQPI